MRAGVAVLNVDDNDDLGIVRRGVGDQPRVVLKVEIGTLRRSRFCGDLVSGLGELRGGGTVVFRRGNLFHALVNGVEVGLAGNDLVGHDRLLLHDDVSVGVDDLVDDLRVVHRAAVGDGRNIPGQRDGRHGGNALADAGNSRLNGVPGDLIEIPRYLGIPAARIADALGIETYKLFMEDEENA